MTIGFVVAEIKSLYSGHVISLIIPQIGLMFLTQVMLSSCIMCVAGLMVNFVFAFLSIPILTLPVPGNAYISILFNREEIGNTDTETFQ